MEDESEDDKREKRSNLENVLYDSGRWVRKQYRKVIPKDCKGRECFRKIVPDVVLDSDSIEDIADLICVARNYLADLLRCD